MSPSFHAALAAIAASLALTPASPAAIGETEAQLERRYGAPVEVTKNEKAPREISKAYQTKAFHVVVTFLDGKSHGELFLKADKKSDLSQAEIAALLQASAFGGQWHEEPVGLPGKRWVLGEERLFAFYEPFQEPPQVYIITRELRDWLAAQKKAPASNP